MRVMARQVRVDERSGDDRCQVVRRPDRLEDRPAETHKLGRLEQDCALHFF